MGSKGEERGEAGGCLISREGIQQYDVHSPKSYPRRETRTGPKSSPQRETPNKSEKFPKMGNPSKGTITRLDIGPPIGYGMDSKQTQRNKEQMSQRAKSAECAFVQRNKEQRNKGTRNKLKCKWNKEQRSKCERANGKVTQVS